MKQRRWKMRTRVHSRPCFLLTGPYSSSRRKARKRKRTDSLTGTNQYGSAFSRSEARRSPRTSMIAARSRHAFLQRYRSSRPNFTTSTILRRSFHSGLIRRQRKITKMSALTKRESKNPSNLLPIT